jgi:hypothetical protein
MKTRILIFTAVAIFPTFAQGATISNFSASVDTFYGGFRVNFDMDPIDTFTPTGVDSILFSFTGISSPLFSSPIEAFQDADWWDVVSFPSPTGSVDIIGPYSIIFNTDLYTSSETLDFTFKGGIVEELILAEDSQGTSTGITYGLNIILNPDQGPTPSSLVEQELLGFATQDDFDYEYLGVPEPSTSLLSIFSLAIIFVRRDRKTALLG